MTIRAVGVVVALALVLAACERLVDLAPRLDAHHPTHDDGGVIDGRRLVDAPQDAAPTG